MLVSRIAYVLAESVYKEATTKAILVDREGRPTDNFDQSVVDSIFQKLLDSHILRVLNDDAWLERFFGFNLSISLLFCLF